MKKNKFDSVVINREDEIVPKFKHGDVVKIEDSWYSEYNGKNGTIFKSFLRLLSHKTEDYPNGYAITYEMFVGDNNYVTNIFEDSIIMIEEIKNET